jgi:hypothetical protein
MLTAARIIDLFTKLNDALKSRGERGEIGLVGGAVMCLVYNARNATRDVDAVFEPASLIRTLAGRIGEEEGIGAHWLNDGAKGFIEGTFRRDRVLDLSSLRVWAPQPEYMLAMKCLSARWDTSDRDDVEFLVEHLGITKASDVLELIESYYPRKRIPPKTQFFIEELFETRG